MKNNNLIIILVLLLSATACEIDNYNAPDAQITGQILDQIGQPLETEQGSGNMRIKMEELSWPDKIGDTTVAVIPSYLNVKQDGSYKNVQLFSGEYRMTPVEGPFFPYDVEGEIVEVDGYTTQNFQVTPYLNVEWVTEPYLNDSAFILASVRFTRNAKEGETQPDLNNARLFVSSTQYAGNNNYDDQLSTPVTITNSMEGTTIDFVMSRAIKYVGRTYYVRVGISCSDSYKKYNYTDVKTVVVGSDVVIPILPEQIPTSSLSCIKLDSDASHDGGDGANSMFDKSFTQKYETGRSEIWPQSFTVDLGKSYELTYYKMFPFDRDDFFFKRHTVATFELYGWAGDGEPQDDWNNSSWVKIGDYVNGKPSLAGGLPSNADEYNTLTDEDIAASKNGIQFEVPEGQQKYRYVRFLITNNFNRTTEYGGTGSDGNRFNISELQFWYMPEE